MSKSSNNWQDIIRGASKLLSAVSEDLRWMKGLECKKQEYEASKRKGKAYLAIKKKEVEICIKRITEIDKQLFLLNLIKNSLYNTNLNILKRKLQQKRRKFVSEKHELENL
jgi:hypothetical protein